MSGHDSRVTYFFYSAWIYYFKICQFQPKFLLQYQILTHLLWLVIFLTLKKLFYTSIANQAKTFTLKIFQQKI